MAKKNNNDKFLGYFWTNVGLLMGIQMAMMMNSVSTNTDIELEILRSKPTFSGREYLSANESLKYFPTDLCLVRYKEDYYLTNQNYQILGSERQFCIVDEEKQRYLDNQILDCDIISFYTLLKNEKIPAEGYTAREAYDIVDEYYNQLESYFPKRVPDQNFALNENPCEVALHYIHNHSYYNKEEQWYNLSKLYIIYKNGNLFLCDERKPGLFYVVSDGIDTQTITFQLNYQEGENTNQITKEQILPMDTFFRRFRNYSDARITINNAYEMLQMGLEIVGNPFYPTENYSSLCFTDAQMKEADAYLTEGYSFIDDYHVETHPMIYSSKNLYVVQLFNGNFVLCNNFQYNAESDIFSFLPISYSGMPTGMVTAPSSWILNPTKDNISGICHAVPFVKLSNNEDFILPYGTATDYYNLLRDYLILHQYQLDIESPLQCNNPNLEEEEILNEVGRTLQLKLVYDTSKNDFQE